ncbi:ribosome 60S biogenesis N-terminal-domain-containing protein [Dactylonectria macrodidyma]|uniref:Ribosome 60S biogenesis N-terminal-domain-containing protein n=1 Tax=Dactylonectria macrodidyma TaxID=307937 RepID=A0A9P9E8V2_9HYPO|nr:ribosome 60S biogenesis N-terminal-domain-containing protein [Dactylonectria macrodidyma]
MVKRISNDGDDGAAAYRKRQKVVHEAPTSEEVTSADQLRNLLTFDQDLRNARHGLQSFKGLLDKIVSDDGDRRTNVQILQQYLESVKPRDTSEDAVFLVDIMEMWSFAAQVGNEGVMSSVAVVLALLLQAVSGSLHLVRHGLGICQTIIQERQLKSLSKNLSSDKNKGFVLSPTLRMLREAVCLDGGAYAKRIFRARDFTLTSLGRNLEIGHVGDGPEEMRKASVRTNAVRFFLSLLKYLQSDGRKELLTQKDVLSHLTFLLKSDPPYLVLEVLESLKTHVLMDDKIPREVKFRSFNTRTLMRLLALNTYSTDGDATDETSTVSYKAHKFLTYVCTNPSAGVLYPSTGLYPKVSDDDVAGQGASSSSDGAFLVDKYKDDVPVYNFVLAEFAQKLRPWSNLKHSELLVAMFTAAPELTYKYFLNNRSFTFEPKLSMTWIGYAAFLFNTMRIPLPARFGDRVRFTKAPPPTYVLLDNLIPLPINQKVLIRCLSPKSHLTSFFATRILIVALEKLTEALKLHDESPNSKNNSWTEARRRLVDAFCQRIPDMKEVVRSYKGIPAENILHRTMASRLIRLYYEVIPRVALAANFDVSPFFTEVLKKLNQETENPEDESLLVMELENLVSIASYSPGMRWFAKIDKLVDGAASSPYTALVRISSGKNRELPFHQLKQVLGAVAVENQLVTKASLLTPLYEALQSTLTELKTAQIEKVWSFVDNCASRCASSPIKYLDLMETYLKEGGVTRSSGATALLNVTMVEQLSYFLSSAKPDEQAALAKFLSSYFNASYSLKHAKPAIKALYKRMSEQFPKTIKLKSLKKADKSDHADEDEEMADAEDVVDKHSKTGSELDLSKLEDMLHVSFVEKEDNAALVKWTTKNVEDLVEDGWAAALIRLLLSTHISIRKEAFTNILKMAAKIKESSYEEKDQVWLLLSELAESSRSQVDIGPVPSAFPAFAIHALDVLKNPLHPLYPKVNSFLTRGPIWSLEKLPMAHDILHGEPSEDDKYYTEITWLLAYLLDSLRAPFDLGVFHKKRWFEKVLVLGGNPYLRLNLRTRVLRLLYRATCIDGGSTTLVTRFGILSWLDARRSACETAEEADVVSALMRRIWETCDQEKVVAWSKGGVKKLLANLI